MIKIGITGQSGFIGTHLFNFLSLKKKEISIIPFQDEYFQNENSLNTFVKKCDTIVHLAGLNRHADPEVIFKTNVRLVKQLIDALETCRKKPHVIFSSSIQETRDNPYGNSKHKGRLMFEEWAERNDASFTGLIIPNVYGPFGDPYYNSVIATFSHQLTHGENPEIHVDGQLKLIYINELVNEFYKTIMQGSGISKKLIEHTAEKKVSEILLLLEEYKSLYFDNGIYPDLKNTFNLNLFNTFVCYMDIKTHFPVNLKLNSDDRGSFIEMTRFNTGGQVSFSTTRPGITRGNHFHIRKAERFLVIKGNALIRMRKTGTEDILEFELDGSNPRYVDMPVWYTHNITNIGKDDLFTVFWINEPYNPEDADTYYEPV